MPVPKAGRDYLIKALRGTPDVLKCMLDREPEPSWDARPDPNRFSLREVLAHLADWEPIWLERLHRTVDEDHPFLPSVDEGQLVIDHDYDNSDPKSSLRAFRQGRFEVVKFLDDLPEEVWDRTCNREFVGELTLYELASFALSHDGYHMHQVALWLKH